MFNKKKNLEQDLLYAIAEGERTRNMLLSFAKELGYEYKSRAVKKITSRVDSFGMGMPAKEEAVLEWYWAKESEFEKQMELVDECARKNSEYNPFSTPKKSSKKKLK